MGVLCSITPICGVCTGPDMAWDPGNSVPKKGWFADVSFFSTVLLLFGLRVISKACSLFQRFKGDIETLMEEAIGEHTAHAFVFVDELWNW